MISLNQYTITFLLILHERERDRVNKILFLKISYYNQYKN